MIQHGSCRITLCAKKDCSTSCNNLGYGGIQLEFGQHFGPKLSPEKSRGLKGFMEAALKKKRPDHGIIDILITNGRCILDLTTSKNILSKDGKLMVELASTKSTLVQPTVGHEIPLYEGIFIDEHRMLVIDLKGSKEFTIERTRFVIDLTLQKEKQSQHKQPGGTCSKQDEIRKRWLSGEYNCRDLCAEVACKDQKISFSTARKALRNMPDPCC